MSNTAGPELKQLIEAALGRELGIQGRTALVRLGSFSPCRAGRVLAWQGDPAERCYLILEGSVRFIKHRAGAADMALPPAGRGEWAGLAEMIASAAVQADWACAADCSLLSFGPRNLESLRSYPGVEAWISLCLAREASGLSAFLAQGGPLERIASFILSRRRNIAGMESSSISATQAEIAASLGLTRETVNKRLAELEDRGALRTSRGSLVIENWSLLEDIVKGE